MNKNTFQYLNIFFGENNSVYLMDITTGIMQQIESKTA